MSLYPLLWTVLIIPIDIRILSGWWLYLMDIVVTAPLAVDIIFIIPFDIRILSGQGLHLMDIVVPAPLAVDIIFIIPFGIRILSGWGLHLMDIVVTVPLAVDSPHYTLWYTHIFRVGTISDGHRCHCTPCFCITWVWWTSSGHFLFIAYFVHISIYIFFGN